MRVVLRPGDAPIELAVAHADLYFFFDVDIVILVFELSCSDLPLASAQEFVHRFGRAYPAGWTEAGEAENARRALNGLMPEVRSSPFPTLPAV